MRMRQVLILPVDLPYKARSSPLRQLAIDDILGL